MHGKSRRARHWVAGAWLLWLAAAGAQAPAIEASSGYPSLDPVFDVAVLNEGLAGGAPEGALWTPRSALVYFREAGKEDRWSAAAHALNLNGVPVAEQDDLGLQLARQLHFVLDRTLDVDWSEVPDRSDGLADASIGGGGEGAVPAAARSLLLGTIPLEGRPAEIRLERIRPEGDDPRWVFARSTVSLIGPLYARHGPGWLDRVLPGWARFTFVEVFIWQWIALLVAVAVAIGLGLLARRLMLTIAARTRRAWPQRLAQATARPLVLLVAVGVVWLVQGTMLTLRGETGQWGVTILTVLGVVALTWMGVRTVLYVADDLGRQHVDRLAQVDVHRARQRETVMSVARRAFVVAALMVGGGLLLSQFDVFRSLGTSLLASAGVVSLVLGIAAQSSLGNLMAGIQLAVTQPIRIGDTVQFDGTWSNVEEIHYTHTVIRTWDQRRLIVPNQQLVTQTLENWDVQTSDLVMSILIYVDYRTPVQTVREKYQELVAKMDAWSDVTEPSLVVMQARADVLELRALVSAEDPTAAWTQSTWLREELVEFLRTTEGGRYLPKQRLLVATHEATDEGADEPAAAEDPAGEDDADLREREAGPGSAGPEFTAPPASTLEGQERPDDEGDGSSNAGG